MDKKQILLVGWTPQEFDLLALSALAKSFEIHHEQFPSDAIQRIQRSANISPMVAIVFNSTLENNKCSTTIEYAKDAILGKGNLVIIRMGRSSETNVPTNEHFIQTGDWKKVFEILLPLTYKGTQTR